MTDKDCEICGGVGLLRTDLEWHEKGFGKLERCDCNPAPVKKKKLQEPQEERDLDLGWIDRLNKD